MWASRGCVHSITHAGRWLALRLAGTCCASHVGALVALSSLATFPGRFCQVFPHAYTYTRGHATTSAQLHVAGILDSSAMCSEDIRQDCVPVGCEEAPFWEGEGRVRSDWDKRHAGPG